MWCFEASEKSLCPTYKWIVLHFDWSTKAFYLLNLKWVYRFFDCSSARRRLRQFNSITPQLSCETLYEKSFWGMLINNIGPADTPILSQQYFCISNLSCLRIVPCKKWLGCLFGWRRFCCSQSRLDVNDYMNCFPFTKAKGWNVWRFFEDFAHPQ